jgi:signal transduction histidine kinase
MRMASKSEGFPIAKGMASASPQGFLDRIPVGLFLAGPDGELKYLNRWLDELIQAERDAGGGQANSLAHQISEAVKRCAPAEKTLSTSITGPRDAGLSLRIFPRRDQADMTVRVFGLVEDVSSVIHSDSKLERKVGELSILCELGKVLTSALKLEEVLGIVLTAVTAGQGLGFNRAFLLLVDHSGSALEGIMALGPSNAEEARRIWDSLSAKDQSLEEVLRSYRSALKKQDAQINLTVRQLRIPLSQEANPLVRCMLEKRAFVVTREQAEPEHDLFRMLQTDTFAVAPLTSESKMLGVVVADNLITGKPIEEEDVKLLFICAHHASIAIEKSGLYQELEEKVGRLAEANKRIAEGSRRLLRAERLSILGQITSQLAHELRNPMTVIGGFARSLLRKADANQADEEYLRIMVKETEKMENVLNNVLDFSKPDSAKREMVSLTDLVDQTLEMMEPEMDSAKISVSVFADAKLPPVRVNPDLVRHALLNIFRNAVWAMPNGGMLSIGARAETNMLRLEVKDTGFGICSEHVGKVFDPFFTTNSEACGLGLTIAAHIIKTHGGSIQVQSGQGTGSTFFIKLPLAERPEEKEPPAHKQES